MQKNEFFQTKVRGTNQDEYQIYLDCANDGNGNDITTGKPLKTFDEWMGSKSNAIIRTQETMRENFISCPGDVYIIKMHRNLISNCLVFYVTNEERKEKFPITATNKLGVWELLRDLDNMGGRSVMVQIDNDNPINFKDSMPYKARF